MSADGRDQVSDFSTFGQAAVAAKRLKVHRRAGEIPANLPRTNLYCQRPAARGRSAAVQSSNHRRISGSGRATVATDAPPTWVSSTIRRFSAIVCCWRGPVLIYIYLIFVSSLDEWALPATQTASCDAAANAARSSVVSWMGAVYLPRGSGGARVSAYPYSD
jgi:hypothetical protein